MHPSLIAAVVFLSGHPVYADDPIVIDSYPMELDEVPYPPYADEVVLANEEAIDLRFYDDDYVDWDNQMPLDERSFRAAWNAVVTQVLPAHIDGFA